MDQPGVHQYRKRRKRVLDDECSHSGFQSQDFYNTLGSFSMQLSQRNTIQTFIPVKKMEKGLLLEHILPNLKVPQSYEVRLTPITSFGAGDMAARIIRYMERRCLLLGPAYQSRSQPQPWGCGHAERWSSLTLGWVCVLGGVLMAQRCCIGMCFGCWHQCRALETSEGQSSFTQQLTHTLHSVDRRSSKAQSGHAANPSGTVAYYTR